MNRPHFHGVKLFIFLLLVLVPSFVLGQIVTASFDRSTLSKNPAAATSRNYDQMAVFGNFKNSKAQIFEDRSDDAAFTWDEDIKITKFGVYFTGRGNLSPELYLSKDAAKKTLSIKALDEDRNSEVDIINNLVNLGARMTSKFSIGLQFYSPSYSYKQNFKINYGDGNNITFDDQRKSSIMGLGGGANYELLQNMYVGCYYSKIKENFNLKHKFTDIDGKEFDDTSQGTFSRKQYGLGVGHLSREVRFELAYSKMEHLKSDDQKEGEEIASALEFSYQRVTFGGSVKLRKHAYYDSIELLDYVIGDKVYSTKYTPYYGFFFSFGGEKGHSIGVSGMSYRTTGVKKLFEQEHKATIKVQEFGLNYTYTY